MRDARHSLRLSPSRPAVTQNWRSKTSSNIDGQAAVFVDVATSNFFSLAIHQQI
jgi:hypothetical protein